MNNHCAKFISTLRPAVRLPMESQQKYTILLKGTLKRITLRPGVAVSTDHFESRIKGLTPSSFGRSTPQHYVGGCIFVDHMSSYLHVEHQSRLSSSKTISTKNYLKDIVWIMKSWWTLMLQTIKYLR